MKKKYLLLIIVVLTLLAITVTEIYSLIMDKKVKKINSEDSNKTNTITFIAAVRNCGPYLPRIFDQINSVRPYYHINCVFVYDNCTDNSPDLLHQYSQKHSGNVVVFKLENNNSPLRTVRIAHARNKALSIFENQFAPTSPFFIMFDTDDVNANKKWNIDVLQHYLKHEKDWDAISFNRPYYYDMWALMIPPYVLECWGFGDYSGKIVQFMSSFIQRKLKDNPEKTSIEVLSAFNGFAIYKTNRFTGIRYDGTKSKFMQQEFFSRETLQNSLNAYKKSVSNLNLKFHQNDHKEHCEHLFYHLSAKRKNNVKIKVSKFFL